MAKYDNSKKYWMQVREDWFDDDAIKWLEEQPSGEQYSNFYMKLCLKSIRLNGFLIRKIGNMYIPYDAQTLSDLTRTPTRIIKAAMQLLERIGLIRIMDDGAIYIEVVQNLIGITTASAEKKALQRAKKDGQEGGQLGGQEGGHLSTTTNNLQLTTTDTDTTELVSKKESKEDISLTCTRARAREGDYPRESYDEILVRLGLCDHTKQQMFKFIQFLQANKKILTNAQLEKMVRDIQAKAEIKICDAYGYRLFSKPDLANHTEEINEYLSQAIYTALRLKHLNLVEVKNWLTHKEAEEEAERMYEEDQAQGVIG